MTEDHDEVVKAGAAPLPYIQVGMVVRDPFDGREWTISELYRISGGNVHATLARGQERRTVDPLWIRNEWALAEDFDPEASHRGRR